MTKAEQISIRVEKTCKEFLRGKRDTKQRSPSHGQLARLGDIADKYDAPIGVCANIIFYHDAIRGRKRNQEEVYEQA